MVGPWSDRVVGNIWMRRRGCDSSFLDMQTRTLHQQKTKHLSAQAISKVSEFLTKGDVMPDFVVVVAPELVDFAVLVGREDVLHGVVERVRELDGGDGGVVGGPDSDRSSG